LLNVLLFLKKKEKKALPIWLERRCNLQH